MLGGVSPGAVVLLSGIVGGTDRRAIADVVSTLIVVAVVGVVARQVVVAVHVSPALMVVVIGSVARLLDPSSRGEPGGKAEA